MTRVSKEALKRWEERKATILSECFQIEGNEADRERRIARARRDYAFFTETYFPHIARCKSAKFQLDAAREIKDNKILFAQYRWARGMAKSANISTMIPLWLLIQEQSDIDVMVLVSKSQDAAKELLGELQAELEFNERLRQDFGNMMGLGDWQDGRFNTIKGQGFRALGRGQSPRGLKVKSRRPNYIIIDDIDDDELCRNPDRVSKIHEWCMTALYGASDAGRGRFISVGNLIAKDSVLARIAANPNCKLSTVNILNKHGLPAWPENHTPEDIRRLREVAGSRGFEKEYMNNPLSEGAIFQQKHIRYGSMLPLKEYRSLVCYTDPSFKSSSKNDYKATVLVGKTKKGEYHILRAYVDQCSVSRMVEWHYEIMEWINGRVPVRYYMEAGFIQDLLLDEFRKEGELRGHHIPITGDKRKKLDKFARVEAMQPLFERALILINEREKESLGIRTLVEQLLMFEKGASAHDDGPDALEGAIFLLNKRSAAQGAQYRIATRPDRRY